MKANELRIGNLLQLNPNKQWVVGDREGTLPKGVYSVKSISLAGINFTDWPESGIYWEDLERYAGIPLTPEWLERFDWGSYKHLCINSYFSFDEQWRLYYHNDYTGVNVYFVHQLQNLYFALTGTELELKP